MARRRVKFGVIGLGLMGKEFGSAAGRWCHLVSDGPVPEILGVCDSNPASHAWFIDNFPTVKIVTTDYHELLASEEIEAVYCAVPHNLHEELYVDILKAGKHLNDACIDISAHTYKANCPPSALTKLPLTATPKMVDFLIGKIDGALGRL